MPWFWPFSKNTQPVLSVKPELVAEVVAEAIAEAVAVTTSVATPVAVATPVVTPVPFSLRSSCSYNTCGVPSAYCLPFALFSLWKRNEPVTAPLQSEPVALQSEPVALQSEPAAAPLQSESVTVVNESVAPLDSEILANPQLKIRPVEPPLSVSS